MKFSNGPSSWFYTAFGHIIPTPEIPAFDFRLLPVLCPIALYHESVLRFILCMLITSAMSIILTYKYNRTHKGIIGDIFMGMGTYTLLTIGVYKHTMMKWIVGIGLILTVIGIFQIFRRKIKNRELIIRIIQRRIYRCFCL